MEQEIWAAPSPRAEIPFQPWRLWPFRGHAAFPALLSLLIFWLIVIEVKVLASGTLEEVLFQDATEKNVDISAWIIFLKEEEIYHKKHHPTLYLNTADISKHYCTSELILVKIMHQKFQTQGCRKQERAAAQKKKKKSATELNSFLANNSHDGILPFPFSIFSLP